MDFGTFSFETVSISIESVARAFELLGQISKSVHKLDCGDAVASILQKLDKRRTEMEQDETLTKLAIVSLEGSTCATCGGTLCRPATIPYGDAFCRNCLNSLLKSCSKSCPSYRAACLTDSPENFEVRDFLRMKFASMDHTRLREMHDKIASARLLVAANFYAPLTVKQFRLAEEKFVSMLTSIVRMNKTRFGIICREKSTPVQEGDMGVDVHILRCSFLRDGNISLEDVFGHPFMVAKMDQDGIHLWSCERLEYADETMSVNEMSSSFRRVFNDVWVAVESKKTRFDASVYPRANLLPQPSLLEWLMSREAPLRRRKEITLEVCRWSMFAGTVSAELRAADDGLRQFRTWLIGVECSDA